MGVLPAFSPGKHFSAFLGLGEFPFYSPQNQEQNWTITVLREHGVAMGRTLGGMGLCVMRWDREDITSRHPHPALSSLPFVFEDFPFARLSLDSGFDHTLTRSARQVWHCLVCREPISAY